MAIDVQIDCPDQAPDANLLSDWARTALDGDPRSVCLRVVDELEGAALNARFRNRSGATNVLAFPAEQGGLLGDVAICAPVAAREARAQGKRLSDHYAHLVVHGLLHLMGMDHGTDRQARAMEAREVAVLGRLGVADPYAD